jgi:hypothetical protein
MRRECLSGDELLNYGTENRILMQLTHKSVGNYVRILRRAKKKKDENS